MEAKYSNYLNVKKFSLVLLVLLLIIICFHLKTYSNNFLPDNVKEYKEKTKLKRRNAFKPGELEEILKKINSDDVKQ